MKAEGLVQLCMYIAYSSSSSARYLLGRKLPFRGRNGKERVYQLVFFHLLHSGKILETSVLLDSPPGK